MVFHVLCLITAKQVRFISQRERAFALGQESQSAVTVSLAIAVVSFVFSVVIAV